MRSFASFCLFFADFLKRAERRADVFVEFNFYLARFWPDIWDCDRGDGILSEDMSLRQREIFVLPLNSPHSCLLRNIAISAPGTKANESVVIMRILALSGAIMRKCVCSCGIFLMGTWKLRPMGRMIGLASRA